MSNAAFRSTAQLLLAALALQACVEAPVAPTPAEPAPAAVYSATPGSTISKTVAGCRFTVYVPLERELPAAGGEATVRMIGPATGCLFRARSTVGWVRTSSMLVRAASTLSMKVEANPTSNARLTSVLLEVKTSRGMSTVFAVRVSQPRGVEPPPETCQYAVSTTLVELPPAGRSVVIPVSRSPATCPRPTLVRREGLPAGVQPGGLNASMQEVAGAPALVIGSLSNTSSSVRAEAFSFARSADYPSDQSSTVLVAQRGASSPRIVPELLAMTGEGQIRVARVDSPAGLCWQPLLWNWLGPDTDAVQLLDARGQCVSWSLQINVPINLSARTREAVLWLLDPTRRSIRDYTVLRQAPLP